MSTSEESERGKYGPAPSPVEFVIRSGRYPMVLGELLEGAKRPVEIAEEIGGERHEIADAIAQLVSKGLLEEVEPRHTRDGRATWYDLTPEGAHVFVKITRIMEGSNVE